MKPKLLIETIDCNLDKDIKIVLPGNDVPGHVSATFSIDVIGSGDFSEFVKDGKFDKKAFLKSVWLGEIPLINIHSQS